MIEVKRFHLFSILGQQQGIALLVVLWVMTMLTIIVGQFCYSARSETNITRNFRDSTKAYYQSRAGIQYALWHLLWADKKVTDGKAESNPPPWRMNVDNPQVELGDGSFSVRIGNLSGLININLAGSELLDLMLVGLELDDNVRKIIVDSIQDWRDADSLHRLNGAENDYYQRLPEPYSCQNGPFRSVDELLLVRGVTRDILQAIRGKITIYPQGISDQTRKKLEMKKKKNKKVKIPSMEQKLLNINAAPPEVLALLPGMNDSAIRNIIDFRRDADFRSHSEVSEVIGEKIYQQLSRYITLDNTPYYTLTSTGQVADSQAEYTVFTIVEIDTDNNGYRYVQWLDSHGELRN